MGATITSRDSLLQVDSVSLFLFIFAQDIYDRLSHTLSLPLLISPLYSLTCLFLLIFQDSIFWISPYTGDGDLLYSPSHLVYIPNILFTENCSCIFEIITKF